MTDELKDSIDRRGDPDEQDVPAEQPAGAVDGSSELDDLLRAIDAAASQDATAQTPGTVDAVEGEPRREVGTTAAEKRPAAEVPDASDKSDDAAGLDDTAGDAVNNPTEEAVAHAGKPEPIAEVAVGQEPRGAVDPSATVTEASELVEPSLAEHGAGEEAEAGGEDISEIHADAEMTSVVVGAQSEPAVGEEVGTPVDPVPLAVAEALAATQQRRRRRLLYVLVPVLATGLAAAMMQVRLGGGSKEKSPAVQDWERGMELVEAGDLTTGLATLENVVATTPLGMNRTFAHARLAETYAELAKDQPHHLNGAIRHYSAVLNDVSSGRADASALPVDELLYKTARCFLALGSHETAIEYFEQIDREHPGSPLREQARLEMAESLVATRQYDRARQVLAELAETHRGEPLGERAFFCFAASYDEQAQSLEETP